MENKFTKDHTNIIKGIAIILLIVHHMGVADPGIPISITSSTIQEIMQNIGKCCVALFTILSGYGITEGSKKQEHKYKYIFKHIKKIFIGFWIAFAISVILLFMQGNYTFGIYGAGVNGILYLIKDVLGMQNFIIVTPTINGVYWYIEAIIVCYLLFPIINVLFDKLKKFDILIVFITYLPWAYYVYEQNYSMHTDREIFYICSFCIGIYLSKHNVLNSITNYCKNRKWTIIPATILIVLFSYIRTKICLPFDPILSLAIILFCIVVICPFENFISKVLLAFGKSEYFMYLIHPILFTLFVNTAFANIYYRDIVLICMCFAVSYWISKINSSVNSIFIKQK